MCLLVKVVVSVLLLRPPTSPLAEPPPVTPGGTPPLDSRSSSTDRFYPRSVHRLPSPHTCRGTPKSEFPVSQTSDYRRESLSCRPNLSPVGLPVTTSYEWSKRFVNDLPPSRLRVETRSCALPLHRSNRSLGSASHCSTTTITCLYRSSPSIQVRT